MTVLRGSVSGSEEQITAKAGTYAEAKAQLVRLVPKEAQLLSIRVDEV